MKAARIKYNPMTRKFSSKPEGFVFSKLRKVNQLVKEFSPLIKFMFTIISILAILAGIVKEYIL